MVYFVIYFILTNGSGYIPPQEVQKTHMSCGLDGSIKGVRVDRLVNPTKLIYPDPNVFDKHCETVLNISSLAEGQYHIATTGYDGSIIHDSHITEYFTVTKTMKPSKPSALVVKGQ